MKMSFTKKPMNPMTTNPIAVLTATLENSFRSGLWQRLTKRTLSLANSFTGLTTLSTVSMRVRGGYSKDQLCSKASLMNGWIDW
eukprot:c18922_g1_i1 orf=38-289(+)